ncbi:hypothetical protein WKK05_01940 [Nostoc sp. UHCC 0302]|uniref:hypothetical protein n=1 Tax=Nostoc sp. UHCC 0302 TaxID=3134896 RepID=UPI00311CB308
MKTPESETMLGLQALKSLRTCKEKDFARSINRKQRGIRLPSIIRMGGAVFTLLILSTGCGNREALLKEITEFDDSVQVGTEAIAAYYTSLNEQELQLYSLIIELNPNCEVGDFINYKCLDPDFKPPGDRKDFFVSPLKQLPIPTESIQARVSLLKELADYSESLSALAGDNPAERFQGSIKTLQFRLVALEKKFVALQGKADNIPDSTISKRYLGPIGSIIGVLGKIAIQEAQWSEIRKSIIEAEKPVETVLTAVAEDLDAYALPIVTTGANERYSILINYYNRNRLEFSQNEREDILEKIFDSKQAYDLAVINKPSEIPNGLKNAHASLVKLAKSDGSLKDLSELRAWLEKFQDDAEELKEAVIQLAQIQRGNGNDKTGN